MDLSTMYLDTPEAAIFLHPPRFYLSTLTVTGGYNFPTCQAKTEILLLHYLLYYYNLLIC